MKETSLPYLHRVEQILAHEFEFVNSFLLPSTNLKLLTLLGEELLVKQFTYSVIEQEMLRKGFNEELSLMYRLFLKTKIPLGPFATSFMQYFLRAGEEKIAHRLSRLESAMSSSSTTAAGSGVAPTAVTSKVKVEMREGNHDPQYLREMMEVHDQALYLVKEFFQSNSLFQKALKDAFVELINQDTGKYKSADLIATFVDQLLRTNGSEKKMSDEEIENLLDKSVTLFSYLSDKDLFADIYRHQLAKRMLLKLSTSDDMERLMISKLKLHCGEQYISKMEGMLNDLNLSTETTKDLADFLGNNIDKYQLRKVDFRVQLLTSNHWPRYEPFHDIRLPPVMFRCVHAFKDFYDMKTDRRRLHWIYSLGNIFMKGNFQNKKSFIFQVTTLQALIMLAFNADSLAGTAGGPLSFQALLDNTNLRRCFEESIAFFVRWKIQNLETYYPY
jgi:cullin 1